MNQRTEQAIHKLIDEGLFFSVNKSKLARHFLEEDLGINVSQLKKEEISKMICEKYGYIFEKLQDKEEIYLFVAHKIMRIKEDTEPYSILIKRFFKLGKI
ncbi:hypothetical protein [Bacillus cereus]|uniref:hypothetical protein n=1 Tax=Bacillus cereus TaxID=1396 RepID=UPI00381C62A1